MSFLPKVLLLLAVLGLFLISGQKAQAHLAGQPPFFKINGIYSNLYPVPSTSLENFSLPQDLAPSSYLVNQEISLQLEVSLLPVLPEIVAKTAFTWDFGDGTWAKGLKNTHTYKQPGSYLVTINAQYIGDPKPQLLESALLNVLPSSDYKLPQSIISVGGWQSRDPLTDILNLKFGQAFSLEALASKTSSGKIIDYFWDFGDQQSSHGPKLTHTYNKDLSQVFPVLRVRDENGFISDSFVELENSTLTGGNEPPGSSSSTSTGQAANANSQPRSDRSQAKGLSAFPLKQVVIFLSIALLTLGLGSRLIKRNK